MKFTLFLLLVFVFGNSYSQKQISDAEHITNHSSSFGMNYGKGFGIANKKEYSPAESFSNPWPNPKLNFKQFNTTPIELGDVNGDGFSDILMVYENIADERTNDPNDATSKSIIYYGSSGSVTPSQLYYCHIVPAGDINKDGINDVVMFEKDIAKIHYGGANGFVESSIQTLPEFTKNSLPNFDFDQDGFLDFIYVNSSNNIVFVWGNTNENLITLTITNLSNTFGLSAIVHEERSILFSDSEYILVESNRDIIPHFDAEINGNKVYYEDIDGDAIKEFFLCSKVFNPLNLYTDFNPITGINKINKKTISGIRLVPAGDLNKDGKFDFLSFNFNTQIFSLANIAKTSPLSLVNISTILENNAGSDFPSNVFTKSDINKDGNEDVFYCYTNGSKSSMHSLSIVGGTLTDIDLSNTTFTQGITYIELVNASDINKDGFTDIIGVTDTLLYVFSNNDLSQPAHTIQRTEKNLTFQKVEAADLNYDGYMDFVVQATDFSDKSKTQFQFFYGENSLPSSPSKIINYLQSTGIQQTLSPYFEAGFSIIGSVDGDSYPEILAFSNQQPDTIHIYKGAVEFPTTPTKTYSYKGSLGDPSLSESYTSQHTGSRAFNLGDLDEDGFNEFCMHIDKRTVDSKKTGAILVFNGSGELDFSLPSKILYDKRTDVKVSNFGLFLTVGDFNGDSKLDIATASTETKSSISSQFNLKLPNLSIYYGRPTISDNPDKLLYLTANNIVNASIDTLNRFSGYLITVPDINGDNANELIVLNQLIYSITSSSGNSYNNSITNHLYMGGVYFNQDSLPAGIFAPPYNKTRLGITNTYYYSDFGAPIMNFSGKGIPELICLQNDPNNFGQTLYRFVITNPFNVAPTSVELNPNSIMENLPTNTTIGDFSSTDADKTDYHTYELISDENNNSYDNNLFSIASNKLQTNSIFNFEEKSNYQVFVKTTDASGLSSKKLIIINITNQNEAVLSASLANSSIAENEPEGTTIGTFSAVDSDNADSHTYELIAGNGTNDSGNSFFKIDGNTLKVKTPLNYETSSTQYIYVRITDAGGLFIDVPFTINITNNNEPVLSASLSSNTIAENEPEGTTIGTFSAVDSDNADSHTYELVAGNGTNDSGNSLFKIDGNNLKVKTPLNYETSSTQNIYVRTTDAGGLFIDVPFTINITNNNEPVLSASLSSNIIAENEPEGTTIGTFSAVDSDNADSHTYELVAGNGTNNSGNSLFKIDGNTLKVKTPLNYETSSTQNIYVRITDAGGLFIDVPFTINVINVVETGISSDKLNSLRIYPNPATAYVNIVVPDVSSPIHLTILNTLGMVVKKEILSQKNEIHIDLNEIGKGVYLVLLEQNGIISGGKFVVH